MSDIGQRPSRDPARADDLKLLAIEQQFTEAFHAGSRPRLSAYLRRYPQYVSELTAFVSVFLPEALLEASDDVYTLPTPVSLSPGARRALDAILAGLPQPRPDEISRVAEEHAPYTVAPAGLGALARMHGFSLEELASYLDLSPEVLAEMDHTAFASEDLPPALARRIAEALGISEDDVAWQTPHRSDERTDKDSSSVRASRLHQLLTTHPSLSPERRSRWHTLLNGNEQQESDSRRQ